MFFREEGDSPFLIGGMSFQTVDLQKRGGGGVSLDFVIGSTKITCTRWYRSSNPNTIAVSV